ncbi:methylesterase 17 isoform X1 [Magnolia sinica]|uniref:methylesterase 17 isoform X1 n=1 Tax=Magnolia sinica TaxID=86752 RepID=UPI00265A3DB8|nr:methylesterase 17 isoform X1 [Magnolia sinica]
MVAHGVETIHSYKRGGRKFASASCSVPGVQNHALACKFPYSSRAPKTFSRSENPHPTQHKKNAYSSCIICIGNAGGGIDREDSIMGEEVKMTKTPSTQHHFVLVHGISHGAWCWYKIRVLLENSGHKVSCLDLAGAGIDRSDADAVLSFDDYDKPLVDFMSALPEGEKVILVGHSAGGLSVAHTCHEFPNKIELAIYVGATMLRSGFCCDQDIHDGVPDLSDFGDVYDLGFGLGPDKPPTSALIRKEFQRMILSEFSPVEDSTLGSMLLRPGPVMAIQSARFEGGNDQINQIKRVYIRTTHDRVVKPEQQDAMIKRWAPSEVWTLESDHSPFFSTPNELFGFLIKALTYTHCD